MLTLKAPAKINWFLHVCGKRSDGYHEIQSLIQKISLYDVLTLVLSDNVSVKTNTEIPVEQNLVYRAAMLMKSRFRITQGAEIDLQKHIPMGAGLGGGSSDAASALLGLNELWGAELSKEDLMQLAEELGSDVPFFLSGPLSFVHGRGEKLEPCRAVKRACLLLVKPSFDVSTAWVYKNFALLTKKAEKVNNIKLFIRNIERAELNNMSGDVSNDLESVTITQFPVIAGIKETLHAQGALFSLMSGSGSTVFGVFDSLKRAEDAAKEFRGYWTAAVETIVDQN